MEKTTRLILSLMIISGSLLSACTPKAEDPVLIEETDGGTPESVEGAVEKTDDSSKTPELTASSPTELEETPVPKDESEKPALYADGSYTQSGSYTSPAGAETILVTMTVKEDLVSSVTVTVQAENEVSKEYQKLFAEGLPNAIVGARLSDLDSVGAVNGSSLTGGGFNNALAEIKAAAAL